MNLGSVRPDIDGGWLDLGKDETNVDLGRALRGSLLQEDRWDRLPQIVSQSRVEGPHPSILLVHLTALLDVLDVANESVGTARGRRLLDALLRREALIWETALGPLGLDVELRKDVVALASFATADTRGDAKHLLRSLDDLADATEERLGAIASALHELYPGETKYLSSIEPEILAERLVASRLLEPSQLRLILRKLRVEDQRECMINVLNGALYNPLTGDGTRIQHALRVVLDGQLSNAACESVVSINEIERKAGCGANE